MKLLIAGSRGVTDLDTASKAINSVLWGPIEEVVYGGASGADELGRQWATKMGIPVKLFPADWDLHGKSAGYLRNQEMGEYADCLVALWNGSSKGTKHMIDIMLALGKETHVFILK